MIIMIIDVIIIVLTSGCCRPSCSVLYITILERLYGKSMHRQPYVGLGLKDLT